MVGPEYPYVSFGSDGTFIDHGTGPDKGVLFEIDQFKQPTGPGDGRYRINKNTIELNYSDGRVVRTSFGIAAREEGTGSPRWIAINRKIFTLESP